MYKVTKKMNQQKEDSTNHHFQTEGERGRTTSQNNRKKRTKNEAEQNYKKTTAHFRAEERLPEFKAALARVEPSMDVNQTENRTTGQRSQTTNNTEHNAKLRTLPF